MRSMTWWSVMIETMTMVDPQRQSNGSTSKMRRRSRAQEARRAGEARLVESEEVLGSSPAPGPSGIDLGLRAGGPAPAAGIGTKISHGVAARVGHLAGDGMDPVEPIEVALRLAGPRIGRSADTKEILVAHLDRVEPDRCAGDVASKALEPGAVIGRGHLFGMDGES